ncbi:MAG: hypothetical protein ACRDGV_06050 [Candidatus Limnocylindria bacterium]
MAVIGARPAAHPWFLPRRRPRTRVRPQPRRRSTRLGAGRRVQQRLDIRGLLVAIAVAAGLGLFYLSQSTHVAATGYRIDELQLLLAERRAEQQQLVSEIGHARSPAEVARRARTDLGLTPLEDGAVKFAPASTDITD